MDKDSLAEAFSEQYKDVEPVGDREEAMTGNQNEFEEETTPEAVVEDETPEVIEEEREEDNVTEEVNPDEVTEQSSLNSEESSTSEETENESVESTTVDFDAEFTKRTDGKYSNIDEMIVALDTKPEEAQHEYGNELIAKLDELAKQGVNVDLDFVTAQMKDFSGYDLENTNQTLELVKMQMRQDEPDITERELQFEISEKYKLDEDVYDEDDIERSKMRLMRDGKKAKKALEENQKNMALPKGGIDPEKQRQAEEAQRESQAKLAKTLKDGLGKFEKESIKIGNESFDYSLTPDAKKGLEDTVLNTEKYFHRYIGKDGAIDTKRLNSDMLWANPSTREVMLNSFLKQAAAKGGKDVVTDIKNTSFDGKSPKANTGDNSQQAQIANHFKNRK